MVTNKKSETRCWCSDAGLPLNAKHIVSCYKKVSGEINTRHDIVVNVLLNNILVQRGLIPHEQKWEDRKTVRTPRDEITVGTENVRSDEWKNKGRVAGARLKPDLGVAPKGLWKRLAEGCRGCESDIDRQNE